MRNVSSTYLNALLAAGDRGIAPRMLVWITAKTRDATPAPVSVGLSNMDDHYDIAVLDKDGNSVVRQYNGVGSLLNVSPIIRVADGTIQTIDITLSQIASITQQLVRGYDVRLAKVEIHELLLDPVSRIPIVEPMVSFLGEIDDAPIETPPLGGEGSIILTAASDAISMLTRKNSQKSSLEAQKRRSNDMWGRYANVVKTWKIVWGAKE